MKINTKKIGICLLSIALGILCCMYMIDFFDHVLNGVIREWFEQNYMYTSRTNYYNAAGEAIATKEIAWSNLKVLFSKLLIMIVILWFVTIFLSAHFSVKKSTQKLSKEVSHKMHKYMIAEKDITEIFSEEYEDIATQMLEIKTTMQRKEQILKEEALRKNDLITYLAHDLKTPLTSVIGYLSLLDEIPEMPEKQRTKYIKITFDKAQRLEQLINEFFDITRYNLQQITLEKETVDLHYMLLQMTDEFYPILHAHGNTIELAADENLTAMADSIKLARVFNNILKNAIAYSHPNTPIKVVAQKIDSTIQISFSNEGKTIPEQKLQSIFEKFFRLDEARSTNTGGAGLGLAIAKEIVALHSGTISATSENGITTFIITLPENA